MLNLLEGKLKDVKLTKTQRKIADYFFKNQERIGNLTSLQVANEIGVSDASIIRFSRIIGYEGFSDLKNEIYRNLASQASNGISEMKLADRFDRNTQIYDSKDMEQAFLDIMQYTVKRSLIQNKPDSFNMAVNLIVEANHRYVMGFRGCKGTAEHFGRLLAFLSSHVCVLCRSEPEIYATLQDASSNDVVICFVFARYYKADEEYLALLNERHAKIILIADSVVAPLAKYADVILNVDTRSMSFFNSAIGANIVAEYLLTLLSRRLGEASRPRMDERDKLTEGLRV